jgi:hypothetical protein
MFLSALVSRYQTDGSLTVDLRDEDGPLVRYGPYAAGMPWYRWTDRGWVETAFDWGARLLNRAHQSRNDLPVLHYLKSWPPDLVNALYPLWYAQSTAMQLSAHYPAARDLAISNPILLWLVAERYAEDASWRSWMPAALALSQRELLAAVLDATAVRPAQVRFLRKIVLMDGKQTTLAQIREVAGDEEAVMALRHWPRLPSNLLEIASGPLLHHIHWLRDRLASADDPWVLRRILEDKVDLLLYTNQLLGILAPDSADDLVRLSCHDWEAVQRLHEVVNEILSDEGEEPQDPKVAFGTPPIPSNGNFQAITTVAELDQEGRSMRHCAASRARRVLSGSCYLYRVEICGERATLQLGIKAHKLVIEEFRLRQNGKPSAQAWAAARAWVEAAQASINPTGGVS